MIMSTQIPKVSLFVVCNNAVYTLLVTPARYPLRHPSSGFPHWGILSRQNIAHYQNMPLEKQALQIIREAYNGTYPTQLPNKRSQPEQYLFPLNWKQNLLQVVDVDGVGLRLNKYLVKSLAQKEIEVDEKLFLSSPISQSILAVAVENHTLDPGQSTQVFVVDQKEREQ